MNLHYDQSYESLIQLLRSAGAEVSSHYIALDYDGEVVIDPDMHYPDVALSKFLYCTQLRKDSLHNYRKVHSLHSRLLSTLELPASTDDSICQAA